MCTVEAEGRASETGCKCQDRIKFHGKELSEIWKHISSPLASVPSTFSCKQSEAKGYSEGKETSDACRPGSFTRPHFCCWVARYHDISPSGIWNPPVWFIDNWSIPTLVDIHPMFNLFNSPALMSRVESCWVYHTVRRSLKMVLKRRTAWKDNRALTTAVWYHREDDMSFT